MSLSLSVPSRFLSSFARYLCHYLPTSTYILISVSLSIFVSRYTYLCVFFSNCLSSTLPVPLSLPLSFYILALSLYRSLYLPLPLFLPIFLPTHLSLSISFSFCLKTSKSFSITTRATQTYSTFLLKHLTYLGIRTLGCVPRDRYLGPRDWYTLVHFEQWHML